MTDKQKLSQIHFICLAHVGDKHSMADEIMKVIKQKKTKKQKYSERK